VPKPIADLDRRARPGVERVEKPLRLGRVVAQVDGHLMHGPCLAE
jgi:hypothetical protein